MKKRRYLKKGLAIVLTTAMVAGLVPGVGTIKVSAADTGDGTQTTLDVSKGSITITDVSVSGYASDGNKVTTIDPDGYIITGTTTNNTVTVSGTQNITLDGVNIDVSSKLSQYCAFKIEDDNTGNVTITLADGSENTLKSAQNCAGLQKNGAYTETLGKLTIQGGEAGTGTLTATGKMYGAGIGGGGSYDEAVYDSSNITITGGTVTATSYYGAGIGGGCSGSKKSGSGSHITISGGTVTAQGSSRGAGIGGGGNLANNKGGSCESICISGGTVTATGGMYYGAGIGGGGWDGAGSDITISGGKVTTTGGTFGAGIGGGIHGAGSDIAISGGAVIATGGSDACGIGGGSDKGGDCTNITISGGTVTATGGSSASGIGGAGSSSAAITVSDIVITGGSVKAVGKDGRYPIGNYTKEVIPTNANGDAVYLRKIENAHDYPVTVDGGSYTPVNHKAADSTDTYLYLYLTEGEHSVKLLVEDTPLEAPVVTPPVPVEVLMYNGEEQELVTAGSTTGGTLVYSLEENGIYSTDIPKATDVGNYTVWYKVESGDGYAATSPKSVEVVISDQLLSITAVDGSELVKGTDYTYESRVMTVRTEKEVIIGNKNSENATDQKIVIASGVSANVTLSGVNIDCSEKKNRAAFLIEDGGTGTVTITLADNTTNTLKSGYGCAGLQKNDEQVALVIDGNGTLNATGGIGGAGIGGDRNGSGSYITINSGTIKATSGSDDYDNSIFDGAGIGGGYNGNGAYITINGGNIIAKSGYIFGSGIGGGGNCGSGSNIKINGGIVTATGGAYGAGIGGGKNAEGSAIVITGGSVKASGYKAIGGGSGKAAVTPTNGTDAVYLLRIENTEGADVTIDGKEYPTHSDGYVYAYLTGTSHVVRLGTSEKIYIYVDSNWTGGLTLTAPAAVSELVYDGTNQALITAGEMEGYTMSYSLEKEGTYETNIPTGKDAATYTVWYQVTDSNENVVVGPDCVEVEIARKAVNVSADNIGKEYGETDPELTYTVADSTPLVSGDTLTGTLSREEGEEIDTYAITQGTLTNENNPNYDISFTEGTFTIKIATVTPPDADTTTFIYNGSEQTYKIAPSDYYTVSGNKQTDAGTYTVTVALKDKSNSVWSDATTTDQKYTFTINKKIAEISVPTASTAIPYGKTLADTGLSDGWTWDNADTVPLVSGSSKYTAYKDVSSDDHNYDYSKLSGIEYNATSHKLSCEVLVTVKQATPEVTVTADPVSTIAGKTITVTATAKNPNNAVLTDVPAVTLTYKIGDGEETNFEDSFVIPKGTAVETTVTITAATAASDNYATGTDATTVTVIACTHENAQSAAWSTDETNHWHICPDCGEVVGKAEHEYTNYVKDIAATCTTNGQETGTCACGKTDTREVADSALGHDYEVSYAWAKDGSSCTLTLTCKRDGCTEETDGHEVTHDCEITPAVKIAATCKEMGTTTYTATYDDYSATKDIQDIPIDSSNHTGETEVIGAVEATCKEAGYTGDTKCKACEATLITGTVIDKLTTHTYVNGVCSVCDAAFETTVDGITYEVVTETGKDGKPTGKLVTVSGNDIPQVAVAVTGTSGDFSGSDGKVTVPGEITGSGLEQTFVVTEISENAFSGASVTEIVVPATVTKVGTGAFGDATTITFNGSTVPEGIAEAISEAVTTINVPDGAGDSYKAALGENINIVEAHTHTYAEAWTYDGTYHWHASTCRHEKEVADKAEHTFGEWVIMTEATEDAEGEKARSCACGYIQTEAIPKKTATTPQSPKKGDVVVDDKGTAKVKIADVTKKEVTYKEPANKKAKTVTIPATVKIDGVTYKVTKIDANAFKGCKKLKTIKITSTKLTSKTVAKNAFKGLTKKTTIKVPKKKLTAYKKLFKKKGLSSKVTVKGY